MSTFLYRLGRACFRARRRVLAAWLIALVAISGLAFALGSKFDDGFRIPGTSSQAALDQVRMTFPEGSGATATMLIVAPSGKRITDPEVREAVEDEEADIGRISFVSGVQGPYSSLVKGLVSTDETAGIATIRVTGSSATFTDAQRAELVAAANRLAQRLPGSQVHMGGEVFSIEIPHLSATEAAGLVIAAVVLFATLGSLAGASMPLGTAVIGAALGATVTMLMTHALEIGSTTLMLAVMLSLAVGIDYALLIVSRHRDQLASGLPPEESAARAVATAGSAVVFAGLTVVIALVGLSVANIPFLTMMGVFAAVAVVIEVLLALTLLPAFLGFAGTRLTPRPRKPRPRKVDARRRGPSFAARWVAFVTAKPILTILFVVAALGLLALPAKDLQLALPNSGQHSATAPDRITYDEIAKRFGIGYNGPLIVTAQLVESDDPLRVMRELKSEIEATPGVKLVPISTPNRNADTGLVQVIPTTGPDDPATGRLVEALRAKQSDWKARLGVDTAVTGATAVQIDVTNRLRDALLPFGLLVVGLSLVLLTVVFRSIWVPVKASLGYLLSVGAAFGATTLVFNQGWFANVINLHQEGPVISFLPIMLMGILFGLAMDYEVFLTSRMREEHVHGDSALAAVTDGFVHSAKVVAAAAAIMFAVFAFFVPQGDGPIKPIAFGLAIGVAIDAYVVRMTLGPAVMKLLGERAWWLPRWLDKRLPVLDIEGEALAHQLAPLPAAAGTAVYAKDLVTGGFVVPVTLTLAPGQAVLLRGTSSAQAAVAFALTGRLLAESGDARLLGLTLPEEAGQLRRLSAVFLGGTQEVAAHLEAADEPLVAVINADRLDAAGRAALDRTAARLAATGGVLLVGVADEAASPLASGPQDLHLNQMPAAAGQPI